MPLPIYPDPGSGALSWVIFDPSNDPRGDLPQPLFRNAAYRAYERSYTAVLNDPNSLILNVPTNKIAYPPLERPINEVSVAYEALTLPEFDLKDPWIRHGSGIATVLGGQLTITDDSGGGFPTGQPLFWTRPVDLSYPHGYALAWRFYISSIDTFEGVFSGVVSGYSTESRAIVVGFLEDGGVKKVGILKANYGDDPSSINAWTGGVGINGAPTGLPAELNWSFLRSYRIFTDKSGIVKLYMDGEVIEILRVSENECPFLEELSGPFDELQGVFFGSISRPAKNVSVWDFVRYQVIPSNPVQTEPSVFVKYEGNQIPEEATPLWTPIGYHGREVVQYSTNLLVGSTSATDPSTESLVGLIGGDFRGYTRIEPLLSLASNMSIEAKLQGLFLTAKAAKDACCFVIDDGSYIIQTCLLQDTEFPLFSYGGRSLPEEWTPVPWQTLGTSTASMVGRVLKITDTSVTDGRIYYAEDLAPPTSTSRVVGTSTDWSCEFRVKVVSYTPDGLGFCGVSGEVYDGLRSIGVIFQDLLNTRYIALSSEGTAVTSFVFEWADQALHTIRLSKSTSGDLVSLFVDDTFIGSTNYSSFSAPGNGPDGVVSFGSASTSSMGALSEVEWHYFNTWRTGTSRKYVGIWNGGANGSLLSYHLPTKSKGQGSVSGNALGDLNTDFLTAGVLPGDLLLIDGGPSAGVYTIQAIPNATTVTVQTSSNTTYTVNLSETVTVGENYIISSPAGNSLGEVVTIQEALSVLPAITPISNASPFPAQPTIVSYRIIRETDWTIPQTYRVVRDGTGSIALYINTDNTPLLRFDYTSTTLPASAASFFKTISGNLSSISFGAFDPTSLSTTSWDYVHYGMTRSPTELRKVQSHQVLNQRNAIASPEHLTTPIAHPHTGFWSSSTGIPPQQAPDLLMNPALQTYTQLYENTPLVPLTQTFEIRNPTPTLVYNSSLNNIEDLLNSDGDFVLNDSSVKIKLLVPDDVLYDSIHVVEHTEGERGLLSIGCDHLMSLGTFHYQDEVCLVYEGTVLPQEDTNAQTPWILESDTPANVSTTVAAGILTYSTIGTGSKTIYKNYTPLPDAPGLANQFTFVLKLASDVSGGIGDSQVRFGFSAPGITLSLGLVTTPLGERYVLVIDQNTQTVVGGALFDFLDGNFHTYRLTRNPGLGIVDLEIDPLEEQ